MDTICFLSGGSSNGDPLLSLGGEVSIAQASGDLFDDFQIEESVTGLEDYRCIYIFNGLTETLERTEVWLESPIGSSANVILGIDESNDIQEVNLSFFSGIGSFTLDFNGFDVVVNADSNLDVFAQNFQDALRNDTPLTDVVVQVQFLGTTVNFIVTFEGADKSRKQPVFALKDNGLGGNPEIAISQTNVGSPINSTAEIIDMDTTSPLNPDFRETTKLLPITISNLSSNEGFPLWIKRTIPIDPIATQNDGFFLKTFTKPIIVA